MVSQIFRSDKQLNLEQACKLCEYFALNEMETEYFLALVQWERAGSVALKKIVQAQIAKIREQARELKHRLPQDTRLNEADQAIFYSNWYYSGARLASSLPHSQDLDSIARLLDLSPMKVRRVLDFLVSRGLCIEQGGTYGLGPNRVHVGADSPLVTRHHVNWRLKAMQRFEGIGPGSKDELAYTGPMTLSHQDAARVRARIVELTDEISKMVIQTKPERMACLNIDWVKIA